MYEELSSAYELLYFVGADSREEKLALASNIPHTVIASPGGMPRSLAALPWSLRLGLACLQNVAPLRDFAPDLIFSTGGYTAAALLIPALALRFPYVLHNLDAALGLANRLLARGAKALTLGLPIDPESIFALHYAGPVLLAGNPVRVDFEGKQNTSDLSALRQKWNIAESQKVLVVTGGSQGAQAINSAISEIKDELVEAAWVIFHQLGEKNGSSEATDSYRPSAYFADLGELYALADLVISRSGAMTLAELDASNCKAILVPYPAAAQNHQLLNARAAIGARPELFKLLEQKNLLASTLLMMIEEPWPQAISELVKKPRAVETIAKLLKCLLG